MINQINTQYNHYDQTSSMNENWSQKATKKHLTN